MKVYKFTFKENNVNKEVIIKARHKEEARNIFKQQMGSNLPLNYRMKEIQGGK